MERGGSSEKARMEGDVPEKFKSTLNDVGRNIQGAFFNCSSPFLVTK